IPIPGRDIMAQSWYQGGVSIFDWTDAAHPKEVAFFDRGPVDGTKPAHAGTWSAYWYNGYLYTSEIARGLDVFELVPSGLISRNEIEAAKLVHLDYFNTQDQPKITWPAAFVVARAYVDQLERSNGLAAERVKAVRQALDQAEKSQGQARRTALSQLATSLGQDASMSSDQAKVQKLTAVGTEVGEGIPYGVIDALMSARRGYGVSPEREIGGQYFERASVSAGASPPTMRTRIAQRSPGG